VVQFLKEKTLTSNIKKKWENFFPGDAFFLGPHIHKFQISNSTIISDFYCANQPFASSSQRRIQDLESYTSCSLTNTCFERAKFAAFSIEIVEESDHAKYFVGAVIQSFYGPRLWWTKDACESNSIDCVSHSIWRILAAMPHLGNVKAGDVPQLDTLGNGILCFRRNYKKGKCRAEVEGGCSKIE
jgi:hypothetical protein